MAFSNKKLDLGVAFLKKHSFFELWAEFKIPENWHTLKEVDSIDDFYMYKQTTNVIEYGKQELKENDGDDGNQDFRDSLMNSVFGDIATCGTYARYIYALMVYVKSVNELEMIQIEKDFDEYEKQVKEDEELDRQIEEQLAEFQSEHGIEQ